MTKRVMVGAVAIGGGAKISVQSMTNTDTHDAKATLAQVMALSDAGADIVRVSVYDEACLPAIEDIVKAAPLPIIADVHFDYRLAIGAMERGVHKLRINPGNIGASSRVKAVVDCAKAHRVPIRIGANAGSLAKETRKEFGDGPEALVHSTLEHVRLLEQMHFYDMVLALKCSSVMDTIESYRRMAKICDYPMHLGVTEAGTPEMGRVKSAIGIGALLADGIGDTIRVSLAGDPLLEVPAALNILHALGLRRDRLQVIACPTCGRTGIDVVKMAQEVENWAEGKNLPLTVAVMGCVVNGPGEARMADLGIAGAGEGKGALFIKGEVIPLPEEQLLPALFTHIQRLAKEKEDATRLEGLS